MLTKCLVVRPVPKVPGDPGRLPEAQLDEGVGLARAIELDVVHAELVPLAKPRPSTYLGEGTVERLKQVVEDAEIGLAVIDGHLSPVQQRNLERAWDCKVIDRTGLILEIFGSRARTREGRLQVELAALSYQASRLVRSWTHLERQRGGFGFMGGPGETQIEADRRMIRERMARLRKELEEVKRTRELHRKARRRVPYPVVALVGYTNAGKSTLFNTLTRSEVVARDQLFATLDPTMRGLLLPSGRKAILSDTVGFVSDLPHELVAAFRATLEEVLEAQIVVHVRDVHHPDSAEQRRDVETVLREIGVPEHTRPIEVLNKIDLLEDGARTEVLNQAQRDTMLVPMSALTGEGCDRLLAMIDDRLSAERLVVAIDLPLTDGASIAWLYRHGEVLERQDDEERAHMRVRLAAADAARFQRRQE